MQIDDIERREKQENHANNLEMMSASRSKNE